MNNQITMQFSTEAQSPLLVVASVMLPCPYCQGTNLTITEAEYHGHTFYHLHHEDYHSGIRKCRLLVYDWDKENMIERYNAGFLHGDGLLKT